MVVASESPPLPDLRGTSPQVAHLPRLDIQASPEWKT